MIASPNTDLSELLPSERRFLVKVKRTSQTNGKTTLVAGALTPLCTTSLLRTAVCVAFSRGISPPSRRGEPFLFDFGTNKKIDSPAAPK